MGYAIQFTLPDDGRSISRNVASMNILVHDVINHLFIHIYSKLVTFCS